MFGNDFVQFCQRFCDQINLSQLLCDNLYLLFLSVVDDQTYLKLCNIELTEDEKKDPVQFCTIYKRFYYSRSMSITILSDLMEMKREIGESIDNFRFRLQQLASRLECSDNQRQKYCSVVFIRNLSPEIQWEILKKKN